MRKSLLALLGILFLTGQSGAVRAQNVASAELSLINVQGFPAVGALLDVYNDQGQPIIGLQPENITLLEDGQPFPASGLSESTPPAQIVVAVNPGPALAVRDGQGIERFKRITDMLASWAIARPLDSPDNLSLVTVTGPIITHATPSDWAVSITSFQPDFRSTTPNVQLMTIALNTAIETTPLPGMKCAILLITPHMDDSNIDLTLNEVAQYALAARVRIFVWFVDADLYFNTPSATAFKALALQTGGSFFTFSEMETFPDLESYFAPLRHLYSLSYNSSQTTSGEHTLAAEIQTPTGTLVTENQTFSLDVQPPNPILVAPPSQIVRQAPPDDPFNTELLLPDQQQIEIIIEFPDNHPRPLARTTLYVDGQPTAQNDTEPFNRFVWDLSVYNESAEHTLVVEAVDSLGMSKASMGTPVVLTIVRAPTGSQAFLVKYRTPIAIISMSAAGIILIVILFSGRLRVKSRTERRAARKHKVDPVTQPVPIQQAETPSKRQQVARLPWTRDRLRNAPAFFTRLGPDGEPITDNFIPLVEKEITFGADPIQATYVLDYPSIAALHARLERTDGKDYLLTDNDTIAGTWVNYDLIPKDGYILKHGDVVHFGQLMYRFSLKKPPAAEAEPKIIPMVPAK